MEILKHGKYFGKKLVFECPQCGCEFAVSDLGNIDEMEGTYTVFTFDPTTFRTVVSHYECKCPECGHTAISRLIKNKK